MSYRLINRDEFTAAPWLIRFKFLSTQRPYCEVLTFVFCSPLPPRALKFLEDHAGDPAGPGPAVRGDVPQVGGRQRERSGAHHGRGLQAEERAAAVKPAKTSSRGSTRASVESVVILQSLAFCFDVSAFTRGCAFSGTRRSCDGGSVGCKLSWEITALLVTNPHLQWDPTVTSSLLLLYTPSLSFTFIIVLFFVFFWWNFYCLASLEKHIPEPKRSKPIHSAGKWSNSFSFLSFFVILFKL